MRTPNQWIDPAGILATYNWPVNHSSEEPLTKSRQMADGAPTSNIGLIPQQGSATPLIWKLKGTIFDDNQHAQNLAFWEACEGRSIYWQDFHGDKYEVIITDYEPNRKAVARNPKFPNQQYIWEYTITMRVLTVFSGPWVGVVP